MKAPKKPQASNFDRLDDQQLDRLASMLSRFQSDRAMGLEQLDGFFAALYCCPELIPPSIFLPEIWGGDEMPEEELFETVEEHQEFMMAILDYYNNVGRRLNEDDIFLAVLPKSESLGNKWALGFLRGVDYFTEEWAEFLHDEEVAGAAITILTLANEHNEDPKLRPYEKEISEEQRTKLIIYLSIGVMNIFEYFANQRKLNTDLAIEQQTIRRDNPKIRRNEPCPCGSGKKHKKCCGNPTIH